MTNVAYGQAPPSSGAMIHSKSCVCDKLYVQQRALAGLLLEPNKQCLASGGQAPARGPEERTGNISFWCGAKTFHSRENVDDTRLVAQPFATRQIGHRFGSCCIQAPQQYTLS